MSKILKISPLFTIGLILTACNKQDKSKEQAIDQSVSKIEILDFHSTHRCMTCKAIDANTKYTLNTYFSEL
ncbi:hypothetical protein [Winogradskyella sp. PC D3.3]